MSRPRHDPTADARAAEMFALLADDDESAAVALFIELLRFSPALRNWLWTEFAQSAGTRDRLGKWLKTNGDGDLPANGGKLLASFASEQNSFERERLRLKERLPATVSGRGFGGLTRSAIEQIIRSYQASGTELGAYLLAASWKRTKAPESDPSISENEVRSAPQRMATAPAGDTKFPKKLKQFYFSAFIPAPADCSHDR